MNVKFEGDCIVNDMLALLFEYANYAGIEIKTALGMGAIKNKIQKKNAFAVQRR